MKIKLKDKRALLVISIKSVGIFVVLLIGYYFLILRPSVTVAEENIQIKSLLVKQHANLLQNRLAIVQLTKLNPTSARYIYSRSRIYDILTTTHQEGMNLVNTSLPENAPPELLAEYPAMQEEYKQILDAHVEFQKVQIELYEKLGSIFEFFPRRELAGLEEENINNAISGIDKIAEKLPEYTNIVEETKSVLKTGDIDEIALQFRELKTEIFEVKSNVVEEDEQLALLARQTTLLNKYLYYIEKL